MSPEATINQSINQTNSELLLNPVLNKMLYKLNILFTCICYFSVPVEKQHIGEKAFRISSSQGRAGVRRKEQKPSPSQEAEARHTCRRQREQKVGPAFKSSKPGHSEILPPPRLLPQSFQHLLKQCYHQGMFQYMSLQWVVLI